MNIQNNQINTNHHFHTCLKFKKYKDNNSEFVIG